MQAEEIQIAENTPATEAWSRMNLGGEFHTLFLLDQQKRVCGTLTDGDIRRGLLEGKNLNEPSANFARRDFTFLSDEKPEYISFESLRNKGIRRIPVLGKSGELLKWYDTDFGQAVLPIRVLIMAGGKGERMRPLTDALPKPLLPVTGKPILGHILNWLAKFNPSEIHLALHHQSEAIINYCNQYQEHSFHFEFHQEPEPLGTAGALHLIPRSNLDTLVLNADLITDLDLEQLWIFADKHQGDIVITTVPYHTHIPFAVVSADDKFRVIEIREKPEYVNYVSAGIYLIRNQVLKNQAHAGRIDMPDWIEIQRNNGASVLHFPWSGVWKDLGRVSDYEEINRSGRG